MVPSPDQPFPVPLPVPAVRLVIFTHKAENPKIIRLPRSAAALALLLLLLTILAAVGLYRETARFKGEIGRAEQRQRQLREEINRADSRIAELEARSAALFLRSARPSGGSGNAGPETGYFAVQVAAHRDSAEASASAVHLSSLIGEAVAVASARLPNGLWYRVLAGSFASEAAAWAWADSLRRAGVLAEYNIRRLEPDNPPEN